MKNVQYFFLFMALVCVMPVFGEKVINGKWEYKKKSISFDLPVFIYLNEETKELSIEFQKNLGLVYVVIYDATGGVVYDETVQTENTFFVIIPIVGLIEEGVVVVSDGENIIYENISN